MYCCLTQLSGARSDFVQCRSRGAAAASEPGGASPTGAGVPWRPGPPAQIARGRQLHAGGVVDSRGGISGSHPHTRLEHEGALAGGAPLAAPADERCVLTLVKCLQTMCFVIRTIQVCIVKKKIAALVRELFFLYIDKYLVRR